jgi:hypothetical protein
VPTRNALPRRLHLRQQPPELPGFHPACAPTKLAGGCKTQDVSVLLLVGWTLIGWLAWALGGRIWPTEVVMRVRVVVRTPDPQ